MRVHPIPELRLQFTNWFVAKQEGYYVYYVNAW